MRTRCIDTADAGIVIGNTFFLGFQEFRHFDFTELGI
jgi:hypothetical protein